jgi:hypothetical protein
MLYVYPVDLLNNLLVSPRRNKRKKPLYLPRIPTRNLLAYLRPMLAPRRPLHQVLSLAVVESLG